MLWIHWFVLLLVASKISWKVCVFELKDEHIHQLEFGCCFCSRTYRSWFRSIDVALAYRLYSPLVIASGINAKRRHQGGDLARRERYTKAVIKEGILSKISNQLKIKTCLRVWRSVSKFVLGCVLVPLIASSHQKRSEFMLQQSNQNWEFGISPSKDDVKKKYYPSP